MIFVDRIKLKGRVRIFDLPWAHRWLLRDLLHPTSDELLRLPLLFDSANVVTDAGLKRTAEILGGISTLSFNRMAIGDRGVNPSNLDVALAPDPTDTALVNELITKVVGSESVVTDTLTLVTTFLTTEGPFQFSNPDEPIVNEYAIKTADDVLIARKTSASIPFGPTSRSGIIVEWRITLL